MARLDSRVECVGHLPVLRYCVTRFFLVAMCALRVIAVGAQRDQNHRRVPGPWRLDMSVPSALRTYEFCIVF